MGDLSGLYLQYFGGFKRSCSCVVIGGFQSILFVSAFRCWGSYDYNIIIDNSIKCDENEVMVNFKPGD